MGPEVETLEDHPKSDPQPFDLPPAARLQPPAWIHPQRDLLTVHGDATPIRDFQKIDASKKGALSGAGGADDRNHV
jgi:hypothetical protein